MPKNLFQDIVFSVIMIIVMVFAMSCYNIAIQFGELSNDTFLMALECLWYMGLIALAVESFIVTPIVKKLSAKVLGKDKVHPLLAQIVYSALTVCFMCFIMTFFATLIEKEPEASKFFTTWIQTMIVSFPMALCWQIFVAGPLVRLIFRCIFVYPQKLKEKKNLKGEPVMASAENVEGKGEPVDVEAIDTKLSTKDEIMNAETETVKTDSTESEVVENIEPTEDVEQTSTGAKKKRVGSSRKRKNA